MADNPILTVNNLSVRIDSATIFSNVSFELRRGEIMSIVGPNGGGKTVLLKTLLGLLPAQGTIAWHGKPKLAYVPQRFSVDRNFPMLGSEFLALIAGTDAASRDLPSDLIHSPETLTRRVGTFSAGELQRLLIAGALLTNPDVLLLDEPTADLDVIGEETVSRHLFHLAKERTLTVILVSHDLQLVYREVDQVLCLNRRMVCYGAPREALGPQTLHSLYGSEVKVYEHKE